MPMAQTFHDIPHMPYSQLYPQQYFVESNPVLFGEELYPHMEVDLSPRFVADHEAQTTPL
jgi:hypothetical protein